MNANAATTDTNQATNALLTEAEIVMRLEEQFNVTIADDEAEPVRTVEDLYETLARVLHRR